MSDLQTAPLDGAARPVPCKVIASFTGAVPGLVQDSPTARADGMHALLIAGIVAARPNWDGVVCIPGPRSLWAHVSAGEVVSFASFISVQMAAAIGAAPGKDLDAGLQSTLSRPERLAQELAEADVAPGRAFGALLGTELAAARPYWLGQEVLVIGDGPFATVYAMALQGQGAMVRPVPALEAQKAGEAALREVQEDGP